MHGQQTKHAVALIGWMALLVLIAAGTTGWLWFGAPTTAADTAEAVTATRQAELTEVAKLQTEVADLRTEVAELQHPTPTVTPSPTLTPTPVPPKAMNEPLPYTDDWTITITGVTKAPTVSGIGASTTANGIFVQVNLTTTNDGTAARRFPFKDFILVDDRGRVFELALYGSILVSGNWTESFPPSMPTNTAMAFDVATDAGDSFILESRKDPTFRVQLQVALRG